MSKLGSSRLPVEERTDHLGNVYPTKRDMWERYGLTFNQFYSRMRIFDGDLSIVFSDSCEELIRLRRLNRVSEERRTDENGIVYNSVSEMCEAHGIKVSTFHYRKKKFGGDKGRALTHSYKKTLTTDKRLSSEYMRTGLDGTVYNTVKDLCAEYQIPYGRYMARIYNDWDKERALTEPVSSRGRKALSRL